MTAILDKTVFEEKSSWTCFNNCHHIFLQEKKKDDDSLYICIKCQKTIQLVLSADRCGWNILVFSLRKMGLVLIPGPGKIKG